jgi:4-hydroxy-tetrahydrodipicolinate synthase
MNIPKGFIPVMLTSFNEDYSIDYEAVKRLTEYYIKAGAVGLFANCLSSEMYELNDDERLTLVKTVIEATQKRVPVVATGTLGGTIESMANFSKKLYDLGVDAVIVINSIFVKEDEHDSVFTEKMDQFLSLTGNIPLGIYECPVPYKRLVSGAVLSKLLPSNRLVYLKDTSLSLNSVQEKLKLAKDYDFGLYDAYMPNSQASLKAGASGLSCIQGNYFPEMVVWVCDNFSNENKAPHLKKVQNFFEKHMDLMHQTYPIAAKYVLQKRGFDINLTTRRQVGVLTDNQKKELDNLLEEYKLLEMEIGL